MTTDIFLGEFEHLGRTYTVTEDDYLQLPGEMLDGDSFPLADIINAAKHAAIQRAGKTGNDGVERIRGDYRIQSDAVEFEGVILIVDANNMAWRAKHAFNLSFGQYDTSVSYGFLSILATTIRRFDRVKSVIVCWDGGVPQFRYDRTPSYKQREHGDEEEYQDFLRQVRELQDVLPLLGVYSLRKLKAEADDLMYHASKMTHSDYQNIIVTTDRDLLQAVDRRTSVWQPTKELMFNESNFKELVGVNLKDFLVYRCMVGDSSDGVPGVKGIGEVTALKLIEEYGASPSGLVNIANNQNPEAKPMSPSIASKISTYGLQGFMDTMTTIRLDIDRCGARRYILSELERRLDYQHIQVNSYLKRYGFASLMDNNFYDAFRDLGKPCLRLQDNSRMPIVLERTPVTL